jgi:hypothetical protein
MDNPVPQIILNQVRSLKWNKNSVIFYYLKCMFYVFLEDIIISCQIQMCYWSL